jgi:hypothetical protein
MDLIKIKHTTQFKNKVFGQGELLEGQTYFTYSQFAVETVGQGFGDIIHMDTIPFLVIGHDNIKMQKPGSKTILLYFAGGYGDAVMIGMVLPHIENKLGIKFDICCSREKWFEIFSPMGIKGAWVGYPPTMDILSTYDGVITDISQFFSKDGIKVSPILQMCRGFGLDPNDIPVSSYRLDPELDNKLRLPKSSAPRIGVNFDSNSPLKSYPPDLQAEILDMMTGSGFEAYLLGRRHHDHPVFSRRSIFDLRDKTTISELAVIIKQMDAILAMDSFVCHMANVLAVPTLVLLSTTSPDFFSFHININCISSGLKCAPCYSVFENCPLGFSTCRAFYHESIRPSIISSSVSGRLITRYKNILDACTGNTNISPDAFYQAD